jgi:hypothetical protein
VARRVKGLESGLHSHDGVLKRTGDWDESGVDSGFDVEFDGVGGGAVECDQVVGGGLGAWFEGAGL